MGPTVAGVADRDAVVGRVVAVAAHAAHDEMMRAVGSASAAAARVHVDGDDPRPCFATPARAREDRVRERPDGFVVAAQNRDSCSARYVCAAVIRARAISR